MATMTAFTKKQIEAAAKALWEYENDLIESRKEYVIATAGPWVKYRWRDTRLTPLHWDSRVEGMRVALTEMIMHGDH